MRFATFFSNQARKPTGLFGRFVASQIFKKGNAEMNAFIYDSLPISEGDHVLEIGFGPGELIHAMADCVDSGRVEGVDFADTMLAVAQRKNRDHMRSGKVRLRLGDFDAMSFDDCRFDTIVTVNTVYFWQNPEATIAKIADLLRPGGRLAIGFHEKAEMQDPKLSRDVFRFYSHRDMQALLADCGAFEDIGVTSRKGKTRTLFCAVGIKSGI
jgi:ubiquinone/menaquinone biosynthesis C-methylase UbiE